MSQVAKGPLQSQLKNCVFIMEEVNGVKWVWMRSDIVSSHMWPAIVCCRKVEDRGGLVETELKTDES